MGELVSDAFMYDCWYFVARSEELDTESLFAKTLLGRPMVFGRAKTGEAFALEDSCPHRGMPLRHGWRVDGEIQCCYHGWRFDCQGTCTHVPALTEHDQVRLERIRVRRYPVSESHGLVWVFIPAEDSRYPDGTPFPYEIESDSRPTQIERVDLPCDIDNANFGLLDPAHVTFVHRSWYWRPRASTKVKTKHFESCPLGFQMIAHTPSKNSMAMRLFGEDVTTQIRFQIPGVRTETIRFDGTSLVSMTIHTPVDENTTEFNHLLFLPDRTLFKLLKPVFKRFGKTFIGQDYDNFKKLGEGLPYARSFMLLGEVDYQFRWYRQLKKTYAAAEVKEGVAGELDKTELHWRT